MVTENNTKNVMSVSTFKSCCLHTCHTAYDAGEVLFTVLGVLACLSVQDALDVAEAEATTAHVGGDAAAGVVVVGRTGSSLGTVLVRFGYCRSYTSHHRWLQVCC